MIVESLDDLGSRALHEAIEEARAADAAATTKYIYRQYAVGRPRDIVDPALKLLTGNIKMGSVFENMIGRCIHELNGRIRFREYECDDQDVKTFLNLDVAKKNQMGRAVASVVPRMLADGNAAMSVTWKGDKDGYPVFRHEQWWDGNIGMFVAVSDTGEVYWAVSEWLDSQETRYRTVYKPDVIQRYKLVGKGWERVSEIKWEVGGKPIGVPVAHFPNGSSPYGPYAESTVGKVVDLQDSLNLALFNRQLVAAFTGAQIYYATGVSDRNTLDVGAGQMWTAQNAAANFGAIPPGDMSSLIAETDDLRAIIGGEFSVPTYRIGQGDWPSGVALVRADAPMIKRCVLLIDMLEAGLTYLGHRGTELKNLLGGGALNEDAPISVTFYPPDEIDPGTQVEIDQAKVDLYASMIELPRVLIEKLDVLSATDIETLMEQLAEREAKLAAQAPPPGQEDL